MNLGMEAEGGMALSESRVILAESEEVSEAWFGKVDCGWDGER